MVEVGKIYTIIDVPENNPCQNCKTCLRLRMMEMGLYPNERIYVSKKSLGMWVVGILDSRNNIINTIALREEEFERMCLIT